MMTPRRRRTFSPEFKARTVELVRTTIDVVEAQIDEVAPRSDRPVLHAAIVGYSREVAFATAHVYAAPRAEPPPPRRSARSRNRPRSVPRWRCRAARAPAPVVPPARSRQR